MCTHHLSLAVKGAATPSEIDMMWVRMCVMCVCTCGVCVHM